MSITRCALAVITDRGQNYVPPTLSTLDRDEEDFIERHVDELRAQTDVGDARGRFRDGSHLLSDIQLAISGSDSDFVAAATRFVVQLADAMKGVNANSSCVVALVTQGVGEAAVLTLLKLDAEIEAAQLEQTESGIRLHVFDDLLPRPGDIQKGFSWPDPRYPDSEIVLLDRVRMGSATKYFQRAFGMDASPKPKETEDALAKELALLPFADVESAMDAVGNGGPAERVVERIREAVPTFQPVAKELSTHEGLPGVIRPGFRNAKVRYEADGFELVVPLSGSNRVRTVRDGLGYLTTIRTGVPLTPVEASGDGDGASS